MKTFKHLSILCTLLFFISCETRSLNEVVIAEEAEELAEDEGEDEGEDENNGNDDGENNANTTSLKTYIFGHSLLVHDPPAIPTPSNETTVPHWMASIASDAGFEYAVSGQYGFLLQHRNLPPFSQWGFDIAQSAWESDQESFAEADFNSVLLTAGNFIQYQSASENYYNESISPIEATIEIFDWVNEQEPGIKLFIYENWPDMAGFIEGQGFPPSEEEFDNYNTYTENEFHQWWIEYHDGVVTSRPELNVKMIPVGHILSRLLTTTVLSEIEITELYEDNAPHGRPTIYFLASLVTYMAMYEAPVSYNYSIPTTVDPIVAENFNATVDLIWEELEAFRFEDGSSRVFD